MNPRPFQRPSRYNLSVILRVLVGVLSAILLAGCHRGIQSEAAVRQGVIDYLSQRSDLNVSQLDVEVSSVAFRQNEADATVSIKPKGAPAAQGMQIRYTLVRNGNRWVVKGKAQGQDQHGTMPMQQPQMPPGHPPVGQGAQPEGGQAMPPAHPPVQPERGSARK